MISAPSRSDLRKNLRALQERLDSHPLDLDARMRLARTCRLLGLRDDAVTQYATVARYLSLAGHPLQAIAVLKELLQVAPGHEETLAFLDVLAARAEPLAGHLVEPRAAAQRVVYAPDEVGATLEPDDFRSPTTRADLELGAGYEVMCHLTTGDVMLPPGNAQGHAV